MATLIFIPIFLSLSDRDPGCFTEDDEMVELVFAFLLLCTTAGAGMAILRLLKWECRLWESFGIGAALGLGLLAYMVMGLGLTGWLCTGAAWGMIAILLPPAIWGIVSSLKLKEPGLMVIGKWERLGIGILIWCAFFNIFMAMAPAFFADSLKYHLTLPKWYINLHQIRFAPVFPFNMPQNLEMIYTAGMLLHSDTVGLLLHYAMGLLAALGMWALAREFLPLKKALWAAVFFYVGIPYIPHAAQGVDLGPIFYTVWAFYAFIRWRKTQDTFWLGLSGALAGLCAGTKYTGIYTPFALFFLVVVALWKDRRTHGWKGSQMATPLFFFLLLGCLTGCPWYLKNGIVTGNPIYPIFYPLLGGKGWNMVAYQEGLKRLGTDMGFLGRGFFAYLISPLKLFVIQNKIFIRGGLGLLTFSFLPVFFLFGKKHIRKYSWLIFFSLPFFTVWVIFSQHGRFLLPLLVLWCIPCADTAFRLIQRGGYFRLLTIFILLLGIGMGAALAPVYASRFIPVVIGMESRDEFLSNTTLFYQDIQWMNENLPADARVMSDFVNLYYLDRPSIWMQARNSAWIDYSRVKTTEDVLKQALALGITHIFVTGKPAIQEWDELVITGLLERLYSNPQGKAVRSITMGITSITPVAVYGIK